MDNILARAQQAGTPLIDGEKVTFVWHGEKPPKLIADFTDWERDPILLEQGTQTVSVCHLKFPRDAYLEYAFIDPESEMRIPDPFNSRTTPNGFGEINHFFYMPESAPSVFTRRKRGIPKGILSRHDLEVGELTKGSKRAG
jgi:enterochelin esterase family protein